MQYEATNVNDLSFNRMIVSKDYHEDFFSLRFFELSYVIQGKCTRRFLNKNTKPETLSAGQYFLLEPNSKVIYEESGDEPLNLIRILFPPEFLDHTLRDAETLFSLSSSYLFRFNYRLSPFYDDTTVFCDAEENIKAFFQNALYEFNRCNPGYRELIRCYILQTIVLIMRQKVSVTEYAFDKYIFPIYTYCREHYKEDITLSALSEKMHFSLPYISNKFKQVTGNNFRFFLQSLRMKEACRLLVNTKKSISEVAESVGYKDPRAFNKIFKTHLNTTPLQYRKKFRD